VRSRTAPPGLALFSFLTLAFGGLLHLPAPLVASEDAGAGEAATPPAYLYALRLGWSFFDAGNLSGAQEAFEEALDSEQGRSTAEVHYALSAVWWQRRNAFASHSRLEEALRLREQAWTWDGGDDAEWDRRIESRLRYIARNFSAVRLRAPPGTRSLPPLPDPSPRDPLLRSFVESTLGDSVGTAVMTEGVRHVFLPSGNYWVGEDLLSLQAGHLAPGDAEVWDLLPDRGRFRRAQRDRLSAIEEQRAETRTPSRPLSGRGRGSAPKGPAIGGERTGASPRNPAPIKPVVVELVPLVRGGSGNAVMPSKRPSPVEFIDQPAIEFEVVRSYMAESVSEEISALWRAPTFHVQYVISCPNLDSDHELGFPDHGFSVRVDPGAELRIQGTERLVIRLRSDWLVGEQDVLNYVDLWFDGTQLLVAVNGVEFGPVRVLESPLERRDGQWLIRLGDQRTRISHLRVESWAGFAAPGR